jgi:hypothetical protein
VPCKTYLARDSTVGIQRGLRGLFRLGTHVADPIENHKAHWLDNPTFRPAHGNGLPLPANRFQPRPHTIGPCPTERGDKTIGLTLARTR